mmetsp:Transcript_9078/g.22396  ORF Transcript_9078/g.22396 Transcript_9078/m.22396 type:complete len:233 (-) Transcript_9078:57-755(-)
MGAIRTALLLVAALAEAHAFIPASPALSLKSPPKCATQPRRAQTALFTLAATATAASSAGEGIPGSFDAAVNARAETKKLEKSIFATDDRPVILFDGVCVLCNGGVDFMLDFDLPDDVRGTFRFAALQSNVGRALLQRSGRRADDISSIVLATKTDTFLESDAILRIGQGLGKGTLLFPIAPIASTFGLAVPTPVRNAFYKWVSDNRYEFFGKNDQCRLYDDRFDSRFLGEL